MTTEVTGADKALASQGATTDNLDAGSTGDGAPKAPDAGSNVPPKPADKDGKSEEHGTPADKPADKEQTAEEKAAAEAATKKAADDKAAADKEAAGPLKDYTKFDDSPAAQAAVNLLKESGLGPNAANEFFAKAIKSGDLKDVDVAGLEAKLGKDKATLVMAGVTAHYNALKAQGEASAKAVHEVFGGADNWATVRNWAQAAEKTDPAFKSKVNDIRSLLDEGGVRAQAGARELLRLYNADPTKKGLGTSKLVTGDTTGNVIGASLSRSAYLVELKAAHARNATSTEIKMIDARRMAGKKAGI